MAEFKSAIAVSPYSTAVHSIDAWPLGRDRPSSFRTRLIDSEPEITLDVTDSPENDMEFDDSECVTIERSLRIRQPQASGRDQIVRSFFSAPVDMLAPDHEEQLMLASSDARASLPPVGVAVSQELSGNTAKRRPLSSSEEGRRRKDLASLPIDNSWFVITSDLSLLPTYAPSDVMKRRHFLQVATARVRATRKRTMSQIQRTCRTALRNALGPGSRPTKCIAVGVVC
ncbi:hypothetical protein B0T26DRAFT_14360 [Lasiosphaeria miniovina]|uniref:Uncharacterized protein n=1 Tax=Lasiosphaeria miniovina TaxID=1954250 RepID=A0AA40BFM7_9PEZI|nr:uncharacterized protein B0T26DRAFT_14360 [Lasiosphaeria miniovina]KAK0733366.1 hypothetical protein B0T26DRAFT_14360 [Lasiosphaeria miniovina]